MDGPLFESRWRPGRAGSEAWWVQLLPGRDGTAFWARHALRAPREGPGHAELVVAWFDPEGARAVRVQQPLGSLALAEPFAFQLGRTRFAGDHARGENAGAKDWFAWNLAWTTPREAWARHWGGLWSPGASGAAHARAGDATGTVTVTGTIRPVGRSAAALGHEWGAAPLEWVLVEASDWTLAAHRREAGAPWRGELASDDGVRELSQVSASPPDHLRADLLKGPVRHLEVAMRAAASVQVAWTDARGQARWTHRSVLPAAQVEAGAPPVPLVVEWGGPRPFAARVSLE